MSMVFLFLIAMATEAGGHHAPTVADHAHPQVGSVIRADNAVPSRLLTLAKKAKHRCNSRFAAWSDENDVDVDTEEVDETWMSHLDIVATIPASWLGLRWCRLKSSPSPTSWIGLASSSPFPLRC
jgi:hypothetical protein